MSSGQHPGGGAGSSKDARRSEDKPVGSRASSPAGSPRRHQSPQDRLSASAGARARSSLPSTRIPQNAGTAVHFGPGNIGRGLIAPILKASGYHIIFAHHNNTSPSWKGNRYTIEEWVAKEPQYTGPGGERVPPSSIPAGPAETLREGGFGEGDYSWITYQDRHKTLESLQKASLVTCATGVQDYEIIALLIAEALKHRPQGEKLVVIACENEQNATTKLKKKVEECLKTANCPQNMRNAAFANCLIDRIVPKPSKPAKLQVEKHREWIIEASIPQTARGALLNAHGVRFETNIDAWFSRKKYTVNTGHAITAYYGFAHGCEYVHSAIVIAEVRESVLGALAETSSYLFRKYPGLFDEAEQKRYVQDVVHRFENEFLKDTVSRVGKDPIKKLGMEERLFTPAIALAEWHMDIRYLLQGIDKALRFISVTGDTRSQELKGRLQTTRTRQFIADVTGIDEECPIFEDIFVLVKNFAPEVARPRHRQADVLEQKGEGDQTRSEGGVSSMTSDSPTGVHPEVLRQQGLEGGARKPPLTRNSSRPRLTADAGHPRRNGSPNLGRDASPENRADEARRGGGRVDHVRTPPAAQSPRAPNAGGSGDINRASAGSAVGSDRAIPGRQASQSPPARQGCCPPFPSFGSKSKTKPKPKEGSGRPTQRR